MPRNVSRSELIEFQRAKEALENGRFHAIQNIPGVKKYWKVVFKDSGELTTIVGVITKTKAEKLAAGLNKVLGVN